MRLKLVFITSLLAAIIGAGAAIGIILATFSHMRPVASPSLLVLSTLLLPLASCFLAAMFVYRHTARRRKLQAVMTAILSILLSLAAFIVASIITAPIEPAPPQPLQVRPAA